MPEDKVVILKQAFDKFIAKAKEFERRHTETIKGILKEIDESKLKAIKEKIDQGGNA